MQRNPGNNKRVLPSLKKAGQSTQSPMMAAMRANALGTKSAVATVSSRPKNDPSKLIKPEQDKWQPPRKQEQKRDSYYDDDDEYSYYTESRASRPSHYNNDMKSKKQVNRRETSYYSDESDSRSRSSQRPSRESRQIVEEKKALAKKTHTNKVPVIETDHHSYSYDSQSASRSESPEPQKHSHQSAEKETTPPRRKRKSPPAKQKPPESKIKETAKEPAKTPTKAQVAPISTKLQMLSPKRSLMTKSPMVRSKFIGGQLGMSKNYESRGALSSMASSFRGRSVQDVFSSGRLLQQPVAIPSFRQRAFGKAGNPLLQSQNKGTINVAQSVTITSVDKHRAISRNASQHSIKRMLPSLKSKASRLQPSQTTQLQKESNSQQQTSVLNRVMATSTTANQDKEGHDQQQETAGALSLRSRGRQTGGSRTQMRTSPQQKKSQAAPQMTLKGILNDNGRAASRQIKANASRVIDSSSQNDGDIDMNEISPEIVKRKSAIEFIPTSESGAKMSYVLNQIGNQVMDLVGRKDGNGKEEEIRGSEKKESSREESSPQLHYTEPDQKQETETSILGKVMNLLPSYPAFKEVSATQPEPKLSSVSQSLTGKLNFANLARESHVSGNEKSRSKSTLRKSRGASKRGTVNARSTVKSMKSRKSQNRRFDRNSSTSNEVGAQKAQNFMNQRLHQEFQPSNRSINTDLIDQIGVVKNPLEQKQSEGESCELNQKLMNVEANPSDVHDATDSDPDQQSKQRAGILEQIKQEVSSLLSLGLEIDRVVPLIYEEEHVVEHLQRIDEFFDTLEDDLTEVRNYMIALLEFVEENESDDIRRMIPPLSKIIRLMGKVLPGGNGTATPIGFGDMSASEINALSESSRKDKSEVDEAMARETNLTESYAQKDEQRKQKAEKKEELRQKLMLKKEELARIQSENQQLMQKQVENSMSKSLNKDHFIAMCEDAREKYAETEEKIKKVERKVRGSVSTEFDLNIDDMFDKFVQGNLDSHSMYDFIRAEYLNLIIARKQFVKEEKEKMKQERKQARQADKMQLAGARKEITMIDTRGVEAKKQQMQIEVDDNQTPRGGLLQLSSRRDEQYMSPHSKQADPTSSPDRKPAAFVDKQGARPEATHTDQSAQKSETKNNSSIFSRKRDLSRPGKKAAADQSPNKHTMLFKKKRNTSKTGASKF